MGDAQSGPGENLLGDPVIAGCVALRVAARGSLRHIYDRFDAGLQRGLGELRRGLHETWPDRIDKVSAVHVLESGAHGTKIPQVADKNLGPAFADPLGATVFAMHEGSAEPSLFEKLFGGSSPGCTSCAGDEVSQFFHVFDSVVVF